jgi:hypothetical protein
MKRISIVLICALINLLVPTKALAAETLIFDNSRTCSGWGPGTSTWAYRMYAASTATITSLEVPFGSSTGASSTRLAIYSSTGGAPGTLLGSFAYSSITSNVVKFVGNATVPMGNFYWVYYSSSSSDPCSAGITSNSTGSGWTMSQYRYAGSAGAGPFTYDSTGTTASLLQLKIYIGSVDTTSPIFITPETFTIQENSTSIVTVRTNESSTISLFGGSDISKFSLARVDSTSASLSFVTAPNFEAPTDSDGNNSYQVVLRAIDSSGNSGFETITATTVDVDENARVTSYSMSGALSKGNVVNILANVNFAGKVTFLANNKRIARCINIHTSGTGPITATCAWKPTVTGTVSLSFSVVPTASNNFATTSLPSVVIVGSRTSLR